jgi:membrane protease YdiL (CAAX protease family)
MAFSGMDLPSGRLSSATSRTRSSRAPFPLENWSYKSYSSHEDKVWKSLVIRKPTTAGRQSLVLRKLAKKDVQSTGDKSSKGFWSKLGGDDEMFNIQTTFSLVGGQMVLVGIAVLVAFLLKTPNFGLGPDIRFSFQAISHGALMTLPLGILAWALDQIEAKVPALQDVTTATQRSVLALLGSTFKPGLGLLVAISLGIAAGLGEEMLFRGVFQYELVQRLGNLVAVGVSSVVFGLLHAVTPMYAFLATLASVYFGYLYLDTGNLAVPIVTHALYDICALLYAHWTVANLSPQEQTALAEWQGPGEER